MMKIMSEDIARDLADIARGGSGWVVRGPADVKVSEEDFELRDDGTLVGRADGKYSGTTVDVSRYPVDRVEVDDVRGTVTLRYGEPPSIMGGWKRPTRKRPRWKPRWKRPK
jgi:hypothetical protein